MYKVFLVEDEKIMREGIRDNIEWKQEGFSFVGEASDGELAYPLIQKYQPDILITDIMMPFMDGLELSRLVKKEFPATKIIILSGYHEFEYAKEAIGIGVTEYLVKPITSSSLLEAVKKVAEKIDVEREQKELLSQHRLDLEEVLTRGRLALFEKIIYQSLSMTDILKQGKDLQMELVAQAYRVILFSVDFFNGESERYSEEMVRFTEKFKELFMDNERRILIERGLEGWIFLVKGESDQDVIETTKEIIAEIEKLMSSYNNLHYFGGIGSNVYRLRKLGQSYEDANRAFSYRYMTNKSQFIECNMTMEESVSKNENLDLSNIGRLDKNGLHNFLKLGHCSEIKAFVYDYIYSIGIMNIRSKFFRQYVVMDTLFTVVDFVKELGQDANEIVERYGNMEELTDILIGEDKTKDFIENLITVAMEYRDRISKKKYELLLHTAEEYIHEHYHEEDISLNRVAASVNISPSHFSMIFSQEKGETFIEYLTNVRMEKAKEMLRCSNLKSSEIAYRIGYKDPHYFSFLFKKIHKMTPTEYRNRDRGN